jgi:hypothetical protein
MSLDEAHLILNVKKDEPMDVIQKVGRGAITNPSNRVIYRYSIACIRRQHTDA